MRKGKKMKILYIMIVVGTMLILGAGTGAYYLYLDSEFVNEVPSSADLMPECLKVNGQNVVKLGMKADDLIKLRPNYYPGELSQNDGDENIENASSEFIESVSYYFGIKYVNSVRPLKSVCFYIEFSNLNDMITKRDGFLKGFQLKYGEPTNSYTYSSYYCSNEPVLVWKKENGIICASYLPSIYDNITEGDCMPKNLVFLVGIFHPDLPKTEWLGLRVEKDPNKEIYEGVPAMSIFSDWPPPSEVPEPIFR